MNVNDDDLLNRQFWTSDPMDLDRLIDHRPDSSEIPVIEFQYDLRHADRTKTRLVKCVHCKVSKPNHSKGFVLMLPGTGERFLIGHDCGKKHYSAHFEKVSRDFREQRKRSLQLGRLKRVQAGFPEFLEFLEMFKKNDLFAAYDELHISLIDKLPELQRYLAQSSGELTIPVKVRDFKREERENSTNDKHKEEWESLTTTEKKKRRREGQKPPKPKKYYITQNRVFGRFNGRDFVVWQQPITEELAQISNHLVISYAEVRDVQTSNLTTQQLRTKLSLIEDLANQIQGLVNRTRSMSAFFDPANLKTIANWANEHPEINEVYSASGCSIVCEDKRYGGKRYVVKLPNNRITPPELSGLYEFIDISKLGED